MPDTTQPKKKRYASELEPIKRVERYYPSESLKNELNDYSMTTGVYKSELAVKLLRSFFAARRKEGRDPTIIVLLP